jgi:sigma-B regulation protein RsbU (phosphoserine phosphatase)
MSDLSTMRVLVVDDTAANLDILVETLGDDYKVIVATDGASALGNIQRHLPDLILLDIMMPDMDGYDVCQRLKRQETTKRIPVIFLTALKAEDNEARGLRLGAADYITKPFNPELVKARVRNHLELKRYRDHLEQVIDARTREIAERQRIEYELRSAKEKMENELAIAARIQAGFLPSALPAFPDHPEFELSAMMRPAREVGGDFYDLFLLDDETLVLIIADVSDKGIPAALYMMVSKTMLRTLTRQHRSPGKIFAEANQLLCLENDACMFVSALMAFYNFHTGWMVFSNAGHNPGIITGDDGFLGELTGNHGMALGILIDAQYNETRIYLSPGQTVFLYTDGVTEAVSPGGEMFGIERLKRYLRQYHGSGVVDLLTHLDQSLSDFQCGMPFDDVTLLALKRI